VGRIYAIALNTFREAVRDRVLYGVLGFATAVLLFTLVLAELSLHQQERVIEDLGLASISLFSVLVAVFLGSSLLYKEIERKTLYVILPKPIRRTEFLLGKFFGICLTALVFIAMMGALQLWVTSVQAEVDGTLAFGVLLGLGLLLWGVAYRASDRTAVLIPWSIVALGVCTGLLMVAGRDVTPILAQLSLCAGEVIVLSGVALVFSSFSTPFLTGVFTMGVWLMGRSADDMATIKSKKLAEPIKQTLHFLAEVVPNLHLYMPGRTILTGAADVGVWQYVATSLGYGVLYAAIMLVIASRIFQRRDFI
jgi:ABC-type transport system involved in multi-copper enzyme maturation permease subunit